MQSHVKQTILAASRTVLAVLCGVTFIWVRSYFIAAAAFVMAAICIWDLRGTLTPWQNEKLVLKTFRERGSKMSVGQFEERLEEITAPDGVYSGEKLEDLRSATNRLIAKGTIRINNGTYTVN